MIYASTAIDSSKPDVAVRSCPYHHKCDEICLPRGAISANRNAPTKLIHLGGLFASMARDFDIGAKNARHDV